MGRIFLNSYVSSYVNGYNLLGRWAVNLIDALGELALGSRLRRLSDLLMQDGAKVYAATDLPFEPRWFPLFCALFRGGALSVTDAADHLGVSHAAVNQTANALTKAGLVDSQKSRHDGRKRLLALTDKGQALAQDLTPIWDDIRATLRDMISDAGVDLLGALEAMERVQYERGFYSRFNARRKARQRQAVQIQRFERGNSEHAKAFYDLNEAWVVGIFGALEAADLKLMAHPETAILDRGGAIYFAVDLETGGFVGTCALYLRPQDDWWELTKMTVAESMRGRQIGRRLGEAVLERCRAMGLKAVMLETNSRLTPALTLYRSLGFKAVPMPATSDYARADIRMECHL